MPHHGQVSSDEEVRDASWQGLKGGINGAARWGFVAAVLAFGAYNFSPVYRSLTFQFKLYLQMSGMTVGGMIEAERRVREHEARSRRMRKLRSDQEVWQRYEKEFEKSSKKLAAESEPGT